MGVFAVMRVLDSNSMDEGVALATRTSRRPDRHIGTAQGTGRTPRYETLPARPPACLPVCLPTRLPAWHPAARSGTPKVCSRPTAGALPAADEVGDLRPHQRVEGLGALLLQRVAAARRVAAAAGPVEEP